MRKSVVVALSIGCALLLGAAVVSYSKYRQASEQYATLQEEEQSTRSRYGQAIGEIAMIQDSLNAIVLGDAEARQLANSSYQSEQSGGDAALARISVIKAGIERTRDRIEELDARLKKSGVRLAGLEKMVARLRTNLAEKETQVAALTTQVQSLEGEVQQQAVHLEERRREIGTVYYTIGSKKELTDAGLVVARGGVLGIGKTLEPTGQMQPALATTMDTDYETVIRIPAARAEVVSHQPASSYTLVEVEEDVFELRIVDPAQFRTVRHLVIMTA
jgi:peptidoglycan hydrolase CwlO-like protein